MEVEGICLGNFYHTAKKQTIPLAWRERLTCILHLIVVIIHTFVFLISNNGQTI